MLSWIEGWVSSGRKAYLKRWHHSEKCSDSNKKLK